MTRGRSGLVWRTTFVDTSALLFILLLLLWADRRPTAPDRGSVFMSAPGHMQRRGRDDEAIAAKRASLVGRARAALIDGSGDRPEITSLPEGLVAVLRIAAPSSAIGADDTVALVTDRVRRLSRLGAVREIRLGQGIALPGTTLLLARALAARFGDLDPPPTVVRSEAERSEPGPTVAIVLDERP